MNNCYLFCRNSVKRILSVLLAVCMLAGFIPVPEQAAASNTLQDSVFRLDSRQSSWTKEVSPYGNVADMRGITGEYTDGWSLLYWDEDIFEGVAAATANTIFYQSNKTQLRVNIKVGQWVAFTVPINRKGPFSLTVDYLKYKDGGDADVHFMPMPENGVNVADYIEANVTAVDEKYKIGEYKSDDDTAASSVAAQVTYKDVPAEAPGEYLVVFEQTRTAGGKYLLLKALTVSGGEEVLALTANLKSRFVEVGETAQLTVVNSRGEQVSAEGYTFVSENPDIAQVNGTTVTGVSIGTVGIKIEGEKDSRIDIPVVGPNLLTRNGIKNGSFEGGAVWGDASEDVFWSVVKDTGYMWGDNYSTEVIPMQSAIYSETNVLKLGSTGLVDDTDTMTFSLRAGNGIAAVDKQNGLVQLESGKIYEFSGWAMADETESLHNGWVVRTYAYAPNLAGKPTHISNMTAQTLISPFKGLKGDREWTYFQTPPLNNDELGDFSLMLQPRIEGGMKISNGGWIGNLYFSDLSLHEVKYEKMTFTASGSTENLTRGTTVKTTVKHYSTTGQELKHMSLVSTASGVPDVAAGTVPVTYYSEDEFVARVDENGLITAVGGGTTQITAQAEVGGVIKTQSVNVTVTGEPASRELKEVYLRFDPEQVRKGECFVPVITGVMTDGGEAYLRDAAIEYTYDENALSYDEANGHFTALKDGETKLSAKVTLLGYTKETGEVAINIRSAALASAKLGYGANVIAMGQSYAPTVSGVLSDGAAADMSKASISYASSDESIADVDEVTGDVSGVSAGSAVITVTVELDGASVSAECPLRVMQAAVIENSGARVTADLDSRSTSWSNLISGYENDIRGITADYTDGWSWYGHASSMQSTYSNFYQYRDSFLRTNMGVGHWFAIELDFPKAGRYRSVLEHTQSSSAGEADVYLIPVPGEGESVDDYLKDDYYKVGHFSEYNPDITENAAAINRLGDVFVEQAGKRLLVFKQTSVANGRYLLLNKIVFSGASPAIKVSSAQADSLSIGESTKLNADITWENDLAEYTEGYTVTFENKTPEIISVSEDGKITALANGIGQVQVKVHWQEHVTEGLCSIAVGTGKTRRSLYTDEKVKNARNNINKYSWAKSMRDAAVKEADKLVGKEEIMWNLMPTQELPRAAKAAWRVDENQDICLYCGVDLLSRYGSSPWVTDPLNMPWKIQCPDCRRKFPTNDFGKFYELGIDENGNWSYEKSKELGSHLLTNDLYPEMEGTLDGNGNPITGWGVDDGWGFKIVNNKGVEECKGFVACYNHQGLWMRFYYQGLENLKLAYLYTGDIKYGRTGAMILDRIADLYPDFDTTASGDFFIADGGNVPSRGKIAGRISDYGLARRFSEWYDAFWPATGDSNVIAFLSEKAEKYNMENPKTSRELIVSNMENGLLREINRSIRQFRINSNFGHHQSTLLTTAIALDTMPETKDWIDFTFQSGGKESIYKYTGGNVYAQLVNIVDRDGHGNEASPGYNSGWVDSMVLLADTLNGYDKYPEANLYNNSKFLRMLTSQMELLCASVTVPNVADNSAMGKVYNTTDLTGLIRAYEVLGDEDIARAIYILNGCTTKNLHGDIFDAEPEAIVKDVENAVRKSPKLEMGSRNLTGYGLAVLRDGDWLVAANPTDTVNTQRDFYIWYGKTAGHGHPDKLSLGVHSYGLDVAADIGTPEVKTSTDAHRFEFIEQTITHNTVTVNDKSQLLYQYGEPLHFDDSDTVKLMDVSAADSYAETDTYRRTLVMVDVNDEVSYGVDFFHVRGGDDHNYSFHALAETAELSQNVATRGQRDEESGEYIGSYRDETKKWGSGGDTNSWFGEVETASDPANAGIFSVDWKVEDYHRVLNPAQPNLHLRLTMLNSFKLDEISLVSGIPPQVVNSPDSVRFLFARHTGENDGKAEGEPLDSLYTSVVEPYNGERYIKNIENATVERADGAPFTVDEAKAVKVELESGRVDYIVYAKSNVTEYKIEYAQDKYFAFRGFVGVVSVTDGQITYSYLNDGDIIGNTTGITAAYTGEVSGFQGELVTDNYIDVILDAELDEESVADLAGKYVYVENSREENGAYLIESAVKANGGVRLNIGNTTLITSYKDDGDFDAGYNYNIAPGDRLRIPLAYAEDSSPFFRNAGTGSAVAGSKMSMNIAAVSPIGLPVTYEGEILPRGAILDNNTGVLTWTPDDKQIGVNIVKVTAADIYGRQSSIYITVEVYRSSSSAVEDSGADLSAGGGGASSGNSTDTGDNTDVGEDTPIVPSEKFIDLAGYDWAKEHIYSLVDAGVINGTSENTYSPADNIKRADFAIMLVRAFGITEGEGENFADVDASKYYARELGLAKVAGIVEGIGNDRFNPEGQITRQDMMLMLSRALDAAGKNLSEADLSVLAEFTDAAQISDYARNAVSRVIRDGIIAGSNGYITPLYYATRAEVAVMLSRVLNAE